MENRGFVFMELIIVFAVVAILTTLALNNIPGSQRSTTLTGTVDTLISDIRSQQTKAMEGTLTGQTVPNGYGIEFSPSQYTLFAGQIYSASASTNTVVPLNSRVIFSFIGFPNNSLVFASTSGGIVGYATNSSLLTLKESDSGATESLQLDHYGVITSVH